MDQGRLALAALAVMAFIVAPACGHHEEREDGPLVAPQWPEQVFSLAPETGAGLHDNKVYSRLCSKADNYPAPEGYARAQSGRTIAWLPEGYASLAPLYLESDTVAFNQVSRYLGIDLPFPCLLRHAGMDGEQKPLEIGVLDAAPYDIAMIRRQEFESYYIQQQRNYATLHKPAENGYARREDVHDLVLTFLIGTPINPWFAEGLATYMMDTERGNADNDSTSLFDCSETQVRVHSSLPGEGWQWRDFLPLDAIDPKVPQQYYQYSAACFWDLFEKKYGHHGFMHLVAKLDELRDPSQVPYRTDMSFVKDALNSVIATDMTHVTLTLWRVGR